MAVEFNKDIYENLLREGTKRERRNLLLAGMVGLLISKGGFIPSEFVTFGIKLSQTNKEFFVFFLGMVILYFLVSFFLNAATDILKMKLESWKDSIEGIMQGEETVEPEIFDKVMDFLQKIGWVKWPIILVKIFRLVFDFLFPLGFGVYAILSLI